MGGYDLPGGVYDTLEGVYWTKKGAYDVHGGGYDTSEGVYGAIGRCL